MSLETGGPVRPVGDRMYNYYTKFPRVEATRSRSRPDEDRHARLSRTSDVTKLWSSQIIGQPQGRSDHCDQGQLYDDTYSYSQSSSQTNIYEDIEGSLASGATLDTLGTTHNSLYFCISEGRRKQLKLHKNVDWDIVENSNKDDKVTTQAPTIVKDDHDEDRKEASDSSSHNLINRKRLQLKRSLNRTCSSIIESIKSIF